MNDFNQRYLNFAKPFVDALKEVYSTMLEAALEPGKPEIKKGRMSLGACTSIMTMNGYFEAEGESRRFKGTFILSWPEESYLKIAGAMLGETFTEINEEIEDVGGEITNITMGNAKKVLNPAGYKIEMSIPTIIIGKADKIPSPDEKVTTITIPFQGPLGEVNMELNYADD